MKRVVLTLAVVLILAAAAFYVQRRLTFHARHVATWLPAGTILFVDMSDLHRTADRWPATALAQIIQAFLQRSLNSRPRHVELDNRLAQLRRIDPSHFFLAVTDWSESAPKTIAGLSYSGSREDMDALVDELRKSAQSLWPAGKGDIEKYGADDIETFTAPNFSAALAYKDKWVFLSNDITLLKSTLDRAEGRPGPDSLADLDAFKNSLQHLPPTPDNLFFMRPALLADKATSFSLMLNPAADMQGASNLKNIDAIGIALKLDGEVMRDAIYVTKSQAGDTTSLVKDSLKLSTTDTILAASERMQDFGDAHWPDAKYDPSGVIALLDSYLKVFSDQGLGAQQFQKAFGPETGFILDWPAGSMIPTPLAMVDVRDATKARKFLDTLSTLPVGGISFTRQDDGGISYYSMPQTGIGFFPLQVTVGLTGKCVIVALTTDAVKQGSKRWDSGGSGLAAAPAYQKAAGLVGDPTMSFTYVDTKAVFERVYGLFRGVAAMGFVPHLSNYVDISKLPAPETVSRHLSPMVSSGAVKDGGVLFESAGPVTLTQATMVTVLSIGVAMVPLVEQQLKGQSVTLPGFPGLSLQVPASIQIQSTNHSAQAPYITHVTSRPSPLPSAPASVANPSTATP